MNLCSFFLRLPLLSALGLALLCLPVAHAANHNPEQSGDSISESDISIESVKVQIDGATGDTTVTLVVKEENIKNGGGLSVKDAVVRFYKTDKNGNSVQTKDGDFAGKEGSNTFTLTDEDARCLLDVRLFGYSKDILSEVDREEGLQPKVSGGAGQGGGSNGSIHVSYSVGKNIEGGGAEIYLLSGSPRADLYSPSALQIIGKATVTRVDGILGVIETDMGRTEVEDIGPNGYKLKFYNKADNSLIKTVEFANPGGTVIASTPDEILYQSERWGTDFAYAIPVQSGPCSLELNFAELYHDQVGACVFDVSAEGAIVLDNYDPLTAAGSRNIAWAETVSTLVADGELNLSFVSVVYGAHVSAVKAVRAAEDISNTDDDDLYQSARTGDFSYQFSLPNGAYEISFYFSEPAFQAEGKRVFDVTAQGSGILVDFDIYAEAGARATALVKSVPVTVSNGQLQLGLFSSVDEARLCAVKVVDTATATTVLAINVGGDSFTAGDGTVFAADTDYTNGETDYPGKLLAAINAGGADYTDSANVFYAADTHYEGGRVYLGTQNRLLVTDTPSAGTAVTYDYTWFTIPHTGEFGECVLNFAGGLKKEGKQEVWSQDQQSYDVTHTFRDESDNLISKMVTTFEVFGFGTRRVREVIDPEGAALATTWTYIKGSSNPDDKPVGYGEEKRMVRYDGYWEDYTYDSQGRRTKTISQYLDSALGDEANSKVQTYAYSTTNPVLTAVVMIKGQEVARSYEAEIDDVSNSEFEQRYITAVVPGANWDAVDNLVSTTRTYTGDHPIALNRGRTKWTRSPDGVMTIFSYNKHGANYVVTRDSGVPNSEGAEIVEGTRIITTINASGHEIAAETSDIRTGLILSHWEALEVDTLGRPMLIGYGDGTTQSFTYLGSDSGCSTCAGTSDLIASETDRNGVLTTYTYDALHRRIKSASLGVTEKLIYDAADRVIKRIRIGTDNSEIVWQEAAYDLVGRIISAKDALGNVEDYTYEFPMNGGVVTTVTQPAAITGATRGTRIESVYADGHIKQISGTAVSPLRFAYGVWGISSQAGEWVQEIKVGEANAETEWTRTYTDMARRTVRLEYPDAAEATMAYNTMGQLVRQTDPDGVISLFTYNNKGDREVEAVDMNQDGVIDLDGGDRITKIMTDVYDRFGITVRRTATQIWATDNIDNATTISLFERDGYGNQSWENDAAGAESSIAINRIAPATWTVMATAPDGVQQIQHYKDGLLVSATRRPGGSNYNPLSGDLVVDFPEVTQTTYAYDTHNRIATRADARTGDTHYTYTDRDEVLTVVANSGTEVTTYTYDALGNQLMIERPDKSNTISEFYLRNNLLKQTSGSQAYPESYTYDLHGRMKTLTTWQNATSNTGAAVTTWNYDAQRGWLTQKLYADNTGPSYSYTDAGRLETRTWARTLSGVSLVTTYGYNNAGDLASTDYSDTTPDVAITYTRFGGQKTVTDATGTRTFTYTNALHPDQEQLPSFYGERILTRAYEVATSVSSRTIAGRNKGFTLGSSNDLDSDYTVTYGYDAAGRLATVSDLNSSFTYDYLANSALRETVNGPVHITTTTYEPYRNVIVNMENRVGSAIISNFAYEVNSLGQRTQRSNSGTAFNAASTDVFTYNAKGEVIGSANSQLSSFNQSYTYDDIGNRLTFTSITGTTSYTSNSLNQYSGILTPSSSLLAPAYDADGNQTENGSGQLYRWDAENRLIAVEPLVPTSGDERQLNVYDARSRRVRKQVFAYISGVWNLTTDEKFIYDDWNMVAVLNGAGGNALIRTYTWGADLSGSFQNAGGVGGLLSAKDGEVVYHYAYDANGNVSEVLSDSGGVAAHYEYDNAGNVLALSGDYAMSNIYRFSTKPLDSVGEIYYYGYRYYRPTDGRWLSRDPLGERGGVNLYGACKNDMVGLVDVVGLSFIGDVIDIVSDPYRYWGEKGEEYLAKRFPLFKAATWLAELGVSVGQSIRKELRYDKLIRGVTLTLNDLKVIERCLLTECSDRGVLKALARDFDCCLFRYGHTQLKGHATANAISGLPNGVAKGVYNFVKNKAVDIIGKKVIGKAFPGEDRMPTNQSEATEDVAKYLAEKIQEKVKEVSDL